MPPLAEEGRREGKNRGREWGKKKELEGGEGQGSQDEWGMRHSPSQTKILIAVVCTVLATGYIQWTTIHSRGQLTLLRDTLHWTSGCGVPAP